MNIIRTLSLIFIIFLGAFLRFYHLDSIPRGINDDEASHGYNAYSLLLTGKDEWGKSYPIFFRESGNYASPLYTYLTIIPIKFIGFSIFSTRYVSALSGVLLIFLTYLTVYKFSRNTKLSLISSLVISISPWSILFSRTAIEANLALTIVAFGFYLLSLSLQKVYFFIPAALIMGLSTHAYHAERVLGLFYLAIFVFVFKKKYLHHMKYLILGFVLFLIIQSPQFLLSIQPGAFKRFNLQNYLSYEFFLENGKQYMSFPFGHLIFIAREFSSQYITYFSPLNLFFKPDPQLLRSIPDLSIFYQWMLIPCIFVIRALRKFNTQIKLLLYCLLISPIPAALLKDPFYTLRALPFFWGLSIVISIGIVKMIEKLNRKFQLGIIFVLLLYSLIMLYSSYFILFQYERSGIYGYPYQKLIELIVQYPKSNLVLDSDDTFPTYIWIAFYQKFDPNKLQEISSPRIGKNYYSGMPFNGRYRLDNIEIRPIYWEDDIYKDQILVGTPISISQKQAEEHMLTKVFEIPDYSGKLYLTGYQTHPRQHCLQEIKENALISPHCKKINITNQ